jgi:hypothetical protein
VRLEASTKPPIHNLIHEFLINMAFTMACPNFKKGMKMAFGPLGVNTCIVSTLHVTKSIGFPIFWLFKYILLLFWICDQLVLKRILKQQ